MVRAGTSVNTMYRSVPPRPLSYTFSDVLHSSLDSRTPGGGINSRIIITSGTTKRARSKTAPVSANAAEEYAERFRSRPTTRPSVIDFDGFGVKMYTGSGGCGRAVRHPGQFPAPAASKTRNVAPIPLRTRSPVPKLVPQPLTERGTAATSSLHLAPLAKGTEPNSALSLQTKPYRHPPALHTVTPKPSKTPDHHRRLEAGKSAPSSSVKSRGGNTSSTCHSLDMKLSAKSGPSSSPLRQPGGAPPAAVNGAWGEELSPSKLTTMDAMAFTMSPQNGADPMAFPDVLASSQDFDDLTDLPRPKRILPRRDLPWVFRFKVKKEMNALSKIMASKPNNGNSVTAAGSMG